MGSSKDVIEDFNKIACLDEKKWDHNKHYFPYLIRFIPSKGVRALDVGCGTGELCRLLSKNFILVNGLDFSPKMIERAKRESFSYANIQYDLGDFLECELEYEGYDCIVSIATIHHLPLDKFLDKVKQALKPGGVLLVLDLYKSNTVSDFLISMMAMPINIVYMLIKAGRIKVSEEERLVWNQHAQNDRYLTIKDIRNLTDLVIPAAMVKRHLFWRYSIVWKKPI